MELEHKNRRCINKVYGGFSLIEMIIVLAMMSIMISIGVTAFPSAKANEKAIALDAYSDEIELGLKQYYIMYGKQIGQNDDMAPTEISAESHVLTAWMTELSDSFQIAFREGFSYQYYNEGLFGRVEVKEIE